MIKEKRMNQGKGSVIRAGLLKRTFAMDMGAERGIRGQNEHNRFFL